jgi:hypothetical protein
MTLEVTQLTTRQPTRVHFFEAQLDRSVFISLRSTDVRHITRPSFDQCNRDDFARLIENLGHTNFLANQPFHHLSPNCVFGTVSQGFDCIIPERPAVRSTVAELGRIDPPTNRLLPSHFSFQPSAIHSAF